MIEHDIPQELSGISELFRGVDIGKLIEQDPSLGLMASANWQDPANYSSNATSADVLVDLFPLSTKDDAKASGMNWRQLQKHCWSKYRTFGPLSSAIDSKSDLVAAAGFTVRSNFLAVDAFLNDLFNSFRNQLYKQRIGWIVRMLGEGELFLLLTFNDQGLCTVRALDPDRIGKGDDSGLLTDPGDVTQTLFYQYFYGEDDELIPDARWILDPDDMRARTQLLMKGASGAVQFDQSKIRKETRGSSKFKELGGFRRFVLHWKNLTGIREYRRDTSPLVPTLDWINLYVNRLKWESDYLKALSSYTIEVRFTDTPTGKVAWHLWNKMTQAQKDATGLTRPLTPGSRVFIMPGMEIKIHAPQLSSMRQSNEEIMNLAGAGARTPQDLWQGNASGTYASVKATRSPLEAEIESIQDKYENFLRYEFLRCAMTACIKLGGSVATPDGKSNLKLEPFYTRRWPEEVQGGVPKMVDVAIEPCEAVQFSWPVVRLTERPSEEINAALGSKHAGAYSVGISAGTLMRRVLGIDDIDLELRKQLVEQETYGKPISGLRHEQNVEQLLEGQGGNSQ